MNYTAITSISYDEKCSDISLEQWNEWMKGAKRANKKEIISILKKFGAMDKDYLCGYNPYNFYRTNKHLIFVHSSIEYFFKYQL